MSFVIVLICPTGPICHQMTSLMLALSSAVPSVLGFKRIKMVSGVAVVTFSHALLD